MPNGICSIDGCGKSVKSRGWCSAHYMRWSKHGDPLVVLLPARSARPRRQVSSEVLLQQLLRGGSTAASLTSAGSGQDA